MARPIRDREVHVLLTAREHEALRSAVGQEERTTSELVRDAIRRELRRLSRDRHPGDDQQRGA